LATKCGQNLIPPIDRLSNFHQRSMLIFLLSGTSKKLLTLFTLNVMADIQFRPLGGTKSCKSNTTNDSSIQVLYRWSLVTFHLSLTVQKSYRPKCAANQFERFLPFEGILRKLDHYVVSTQGVFSCLVHTFQTTKKNVHDGNLYSRLQNVQFYGTTPQ
jgi:hypothetical protein